MLARAGLGNDPFLTHAQGQQRLPKGVVDLVGAGVVEILTLQPDAGTTIGPAVMGCETLRFVERRGSAHIIFEEMIELRFETRVIPGLSRCLFQLGEGGHQRFRDVLTAIAPETAVSAWTRSRLQAGWIRGAAGAGRQGAGH